MIGQFFSTVFYQPVFNLLIGLVVFVPGGDMGVAILLLTLLVKLVLWPFSNKALRSQKALQDLQPKVEALKKQYAGKQEEMSKALMALYSKEKVSPFSSCGLVLVQLPVFIALYQALVHGLKSQGFELLYPFIPNPGTISPMLFGLVDLSTPSPVLALLAGAAQFFQARSMITRQQPKQTPGATDEQMLATMNKQMLYVMPVMTVVLGWTLPGGLALYWLATNLLTMAQQEHYFHFVHGKHVVPPKVA